MDSGCEKTLEHYRLMLDERGRFLDTIRSLSMPDYNEFRELEETAKRLGVDVKLGGGTSRLDRAFWTKQMRDVASEIYKKAKSNPGEWETTSTERLDGITRFIETSDRLSILSDSGQENVLKHLFISMMASFDSVVSEICSLALDKDIRLIAQLLEKKTAEVKYRLEDFVNAANYEQVKANLIAKCLEEKSQLTRRIKFILQLLDGDDLQCVYELVARRNAFMHAGAKVDKKYLETSGNPLNLVLGDWLRVTEDYLSEAERSCYDLVNSALWVISDMPSSQ